MRVPEVEIKNWVITKPTIVKEEVSKDGQKYYSYFSQDSGNRSGVETTENTSCGILTSVHRTRRIAIKL